MVTLFTIWKFPAYQILRRYVSNLNITLHWRVSVVYVLKVRILINQMVIQQI